MWPAPRWLLPRFVQLGRADALDCPLYDSKGQAVAVTAGTYSLLDSNGTPVVDAALVVVASNVATYALAIDFGDGYTVPQDQWRERWVLDGRTYEREVWVCRRAPVAHITTEDLFRMHPQWRTQLPKSRTNYAEPIEDAWSEMVGRLLGDGLIPHRTLNWWALATVHKYWAASIVCRDFATDNPSDSRWERNAAAYWDRSQTEYETRTKVQADNDEDGVADQPGRLESVEPQLFLTDVPVGGLSYSPLDPRGWR